MIQEHHATRLHWDLRLEREGCWPRGRCRAGCPRDPDRNRLAVHTEDHPLEYLEFAGEIPKGEYGGGHDGDLGPRHLRGREVGATAKLIVRFDGERVSGRYALFRTRGKDWMIHRMDPAGARASRCPSALAPMLASPGADAERDPDESWGFEIHWAGERAIALCDTGHLTLLDAGGRDLRPRFPELGAIRSGSAANRLRSTGCVAVLGEGGSASAEAPRAPPRRVARTPRSAAAASDSPATLIAFDLLHAGRESLLELPYERAPRAARGARARGDAVAGSRLSPR